MFDGMSGRPLPPCAALVLRRRSSGALDVRFGRLGGRGVSRLIVLSQN